MNELVEIGRLLADLKRHSERHALSYGEVVMIEDLISAFEIARARAAEDHHSALPDTRLQFDDLRSSVPSFKGR